MHKIMSEVVYFLQNLLLSTGRKRPKKILKTSMSIKDKKRFLFLFLTKIGEKDKTDYFYQAGKI